MCVPLVLAALVLAAALTRGRGGAARMPSTTRMPLRAFLRTSTAGRPTTG